MVILGKEYFGNVQNIKKDLNTFRVKWGVESIAELSVSIPKPGDEAKLSNGQRMKWNTYLTQAIRYIPKPKEWEEYKTASILDELCRMIGIKREKRLELGQEYFQNKDNIWKDLEAFRVVGRVESIEKLNTENPKTSDEAELSNGEKMKWNTYLSQAKRYLPKPNWLEEYKQASALDELCRMIGVDREKRLVLGQEYFQNKNNIWKDLEAFQVVGGVESLEKLGTGNPKTRDEAELSNGEKMSWETYLTQAIKHLPKPKEWEEYKLASVLDELCRMIGVERVKK